MQCAAKSKQSGEQCKRSVVPGRNVCAIHGGKTPSGIASPSWKHGRYSQYLPERMRADYEASLRDQDLLSLRNGISALDALVLDVIRTLDSGESGSLWSDIQTHKRAYEVALKSSNRVGAQTALERMFGVIEHGAQDAKNRAEVADLLDKRRKLGDAERRRLIDMQRFVDTAVVTNVLTAVLVTVREGAGRYIADGTACREFLAAVNVAVQRALGSAALPGADDDADPEDDAE